MEASTPEDLDTLFRRALRYLEFGETVAAKDALKASVEIDPSYAPAWSKLGDVYVLLKDLNKGRECFRKAMELQPDWTEPIANLGLLEFSQEQYKEARNILKKYLALHGDDIETLVVLARSAFNLDDCKTVLSTTSRIIELDEDVYQAWEMRGLCHAKSSNFSSACVSLNMAIELNPSSISALNAVGDLCYESQNYTGAVDCFNPSLSKLKKQPKILFRLGTSLWFLERWKEAILHLEQYVELVPDDPAGWNNLGVALREKGEVVKALDCYRRALQLDSNCAAAKNNLETAMNKQVII